MAAVRRCDRLRISANAASLGISCSSMLNRSNWALKALFHPQGSMLLMGSDANCCFPASRQGFTFLRLMALRAFSTSSTNTTSSLFAHSAGNQLRSWRNCRPAWGAVKLLKPLASAKSCSGLKICSVIVFTICLQNYE